MNCQTCRQHLEPFLDDELSVKENVSVLEHVTGCAACQQVFDAEKRIRVALREKLSRGACPLEVAARAFAAVRASMPGPRFLRWAAWAIPAAAAIVVAFLIPFWHGTEPGNSPLGGASPFRKTFAAERMHDHEMHGEFLKWAGLRYDELTENLEPKQILTEAVLQKVEPRARAVAPFAEFQKVVNAELGHPLTLPPGFVEGGQIVGGELLDWHEGRVQQVIVAYPAKDPDRELVLYEISGCQAKKLASEITQLVASLHPVESDPDRHVSISTCKGCDVVLVIRGCRTYLLISRHGRDWDDDWLVARARKLLD